MIKVINLSKSYGSQNLFENINFNINSKERVGLVGRNGHGKTTLFRIIIGQEHPDTGELVIPKNYTLGHVSQHLNFSSNTVIDEGCLGLPEHQKDDRWRVEKILFGLGFSKDDMTRSPLEFSGGYQVRLNLGKILVSEPDLLLLDEPTNYLDIVSIRWLSNFLKQWPSELMLITHDRLFMDSITTHTIGMHRKKIRKIEGPTGKLYEQILKEEEIHEKTRINDEKKRKEVELFITRFRAKARLAGMVQSRIKALDKHENLDKLDRIKTLDFSFNYKPFNGKVLLNASNINFSYTDNTDPLIKNFNISIGKHDRICVIGKNGKGKTTLLKLLNEELKINNGDIISHPNTETGYFAQTNTIKLNESLTIEDEIMSSGCDRQTARNISGAVMFEGDDALKKIKILSGGEKSRVLLGKLLATPTNILFLDEPTNHLDMESCDALLAAIDDFDGAVIIVTHNEMFLHSLANRFIVFQSNGISVFEGTYQSFLDRVGWEDEDILKKNKNSQLSETVNKKDLRKIRADILTKRSKELTPIQKKITKTEYAIENLEKKFNNLNNKMIEASSTGDGIKIAELSKTIHQVQLDIDNLYSDLEIQTIESDKISNEYDIKLKKIEE